MDWSNWGLLGIGLLVGAAIVKMGRLPDRSREDSRSPVSDPETRVSMLLQEIEQLKLNYRLATASAAFKGGFLARISHELKSPLNSIIGSQQIILADLCNDADEEREFLEQANQSTLKMVNLLEEILLVSKIERGKVPVKSVPLSVTQLLEQVRSLTYIQAADRNFPLHIQMPDPDLQLWGDVALLRQILVYLVETAISNMQEGSICLSVRDVPAQGKMPAQVQICLDSPCSIEIWNDPVDFLKSEPKPTESPQLSSGLNLLANQMLLEWMHGKLEVLAEPPACDPLHLTRIQCSLPQVTLAAPRTDCTAPSS
jgi:signal transduction histidine kinase